MRPDMTRLFEQPATFIPRRSGCAELSAQELQTLRMTLVDRGDFYLAEYGREFTIRHEAAGEAAAAGMAGEELNPNPFETEAA